MLDRIRARQWALADIDWDAPGAECITEEQFEHLKRFMTDLVWIEQIGARGFAGLARQAPDPTLAEIYRYFHAEEQRHANAELALMRRWGMLDGALVKFLLDGSGRAGPGLRGDAAVDLVPRLVRVTGLLKVFLTDPVWVLPALTIPGPLGIPALVLQLPLVERVGRLVADRVARATAGDPHDPLTAVAEWLAGVSLRLQVRDAWTRRQLTPDRRWDRPPVRFSNGFYAALGADGCELIT